MADLPFNAWLAIALIIGATVLSMLYTLAAVIRDEAHVIELKRRVVDLRRRYAEELKAAGPDADAEVIELTEADFVEEPAAKAA